MTNNKTSGERQQDQVDTTGADAAAEQQEPVRLFNDGDGADVEQRLEAALAEVQDLTDQLQRSRAELINYRRRKEQEQEQLRVKAIESSLLKILPVADDFHRAIVSLPDDTETNSWAEGFRLIEANLRKALEVQGVTVMESVGKPFDPTRHDAVMFDGDTDGEHMVVEEFQRGYLIEDRVLRPAMVRVGSIQSDEPDA